MSLPLPRASKHVASLACILGLGLGLSPLFACGIRSQLASQDAPDAETDAAPEAAAEAAPAVPPSNRCAQDAGCGHSPLFVAPSTITLDYHSEPPYSASEEECTWGVFHAAIEASGRMVYQECFQGQLATAEHMVSAEQYRTLWSKIGAMCEVPLPKCCSMDGFQYTLTLGDDGGSSAFLFDDYNCHHRSDVLYARGDVQGIKYLLRSIALSP